MAKPDDHHNDAGAQGSDRTQEARLAAALRVNLVRRKVAVRAAAARATTRPGEEPPQ